MKYVLIKKYKLTILKYFTNIVKLIKKEFYS